MVTSSLPASQDLVFVTVLVVFALEAVPRGIDLRPLGDVFLVAEVFRLADFDLEEAAFFATVFLVTGFLATGSAPLGMPGDRAGRLVKCHR